MDTNTVELWVIREGQAMDSEHWRVVPHGGMTSVTWDDREVAGFDDPTVTWNGAAISITTPKMVRHGTEYCAQDYLNMGHDGALSDVMGRAWPAAIEINKAGEQVQSAHMCVNGETHVPPKMNFYFQLSLTTPEGFTMSLLLGQSHVGHGLWGEVKDLYEAGKHAAKACDAAEEEDDYAFLKQTYQFGKAVSGLFDDKNLWHLTAMGSLAYPCAVFEYRQNTKHESNRDKAKTRLVCIGETKAKGYEGQVQAATFFVLPGEHYRFGLKVHKPRPLL